MNEIMKKLAEKLNSFFYFISWGFFFSFGYFGACHNFSLLSE